MDDIKSLYPNQYYAQYDSSKTPAPVTGWWDMWAMSCDPSLLPPVKELLPLTGEQWQDHISNAQSGKAVEDGKIVDYTPEPTPIPLKEQAQYAIGQARSYVQNQYAILNEPTPDAWVSYLRALMAIADGTDAKSTTLPSAPTA